MARPKVEDWRGWIEQAHRYRKVFGRSDDWPTYRDYYRGEYSGYNRTSSGVLPYNQVYSLYELMEPSLYLNDPFVSVQKRGMFKPGMDVVAQIWTCIDNWMMNELAIGDAVRMAIKHAYFCNRGILKVGYDSEFGYAQSAERQVLAELGLESESASQLDRTGKEFTEYNVNIKPGMPWVVPVDPDYFLLNFGARSLSDCVWVDHVIIRRLDDVKGDSRYKNTKSLEGSHLDRAMVLKNKGMLLDELEKDADLLELHEIRDRKRREVLVLCTGGGDTNQSSDSFIYGPDDDPLQIEGVPFVDLCFNVDPEYYWGPSDVRIFEPQQIELNDSETQLLKHARIALLKFLYPKGAISGTELNKLLSGEVGPAVEMNVSPGQLAGSVVALQPHITPELFNYPDVQTSRIRELMGISRQRQGELPPGRRTATEIQVSEAGHDLRMGKRRQVVSECIGRTLRKLNQIIMRFWSTKKVVEVVGYDAMRYWVEFTPEQMTLEYNMKVDIEGMLPSSQQQRRQDILMLIQALGNNPQVNINYLMQMLVREFGWLDATQLFPPAPEAQSGQPMNMRDFQGQQARLQSNPAMIQQRAGGVAQGLAGMMGSGGR